jgi:hypothetical protein
MEGINHPNIKNIEGLLEKDGQVQNKAPAKNFDGKPKFISLINGTLYETTVLANDVFRPIISEHHNFRNVKFTIDDKYVITDIRYDAKWYYLDWQDDFKGYLNEE